MAYQTRDVVDAMREDAGLSVLEMRVDGGASVMDVLLQFQADLLGVPVRRPVVHETTALGAAYLAGLGVGVWSSRAEVAEHWRLDREYLPGDRAAADRLHARWLRAVERSRAWAEE
jgi:glycerol kinase